MSCDLVPNTGLKTTMELYRAIFLRSPRAHLLNTKSSGALPSLELSSSYYQLEMIWANRSSWSISGFQYVDWKNRALLPTISTPELWFWTCQLHFPVSCLNRTDLQKSLKSHFTQQTEIKLQTLGELQIISSFGVSLGLPPNDVICVLSSMPTYSQERLTA